MKTKKGRQLAHQQVGVPSKQSKTFRSKSASPRKRKADDVDLPDQRPVKRRKADSPRRFKDKPDVVLEDSADEDDRVIAEMTRLIGENSKTVDDGLDGPHRILCSSSHFADLLKYDEQSEGDDERFPEPTNDNQSIEDFEGEESVGSEENESVDGVDNIDSDDDDDDEVIRKMKKKLGLDKESGKRFNDGLDGVCRILSHISPDRRLLEFCNAL